MEAVTCPCHNGGADLTCWVGRRLHVHGVSVCCGCQSWDEVSNKVVLTLGVGDQLAIHSASKPHTEEGLTRSRKHRQERC